MNPKELAESHYGMVDVVVDKFLSLEKWKRYKIFREELYDQAVVDLVKAANKYDESRGTRFDTFASFVIRNGMKDLIKKTLWKDLNKKEYIEDIVDTDREPRTNDDWEEEIPKYSKFVKEMEPEKAIDKVIYYEVILGDNSIVDLAKRFKCSARRLYYRKEKIIKTLKERNNI